MIGHKDWRADGHRWFNQGTTSLPRRNPLVKKDYFYIQTDMGGASKAFLRNIFFLPNDKETGPFLDTSMPDLIRQQCLFDVSLVKLKIGRRRLKTPMHI